MNELVTDTLRALSRDRAPLGNLCLQPAPDTRLTRYEHEERMHTHVYSRYAVGVAPMQSTCSQQCPVTAGMHDR